MRASSAHNNMPTMSNFSTLFFAVFRRLIPWVFISSFYLLCFDFILSFCFHLRMQEPLHHILSFIYSYFQLQNLVTLFLFDVWNIVFAVFVVFNGKYWSSLLSPSLTVIDWLRNAVFLLLYSIFSSFLMFPILINDPFLSSLSSWKQLLLPIITVFYLTWTCLLYPRKRQTTHTIPSISSSFLIEFKRFHQGILIEKKGPLRKLLAFFFLLVVLKCFIMILKNALIVKKFFILDTVVLLDELLGTRQLLECFGIVLFIILTASFFIHCLFYCVSLPIDFWKLQEISTSGSVAKADTNNEDLLMEAIDNKSVFTEDFFSLKDCCNDYEEKQRQQGKFAATSSSFNPRDKLGQHSISLQRELIISTPLSQHLVDYYQKQLNSFYQNQTMNSQSLFFPVLPLFHPFSSSSYDINEIEHKHVITFLKPMMSSVSYFFRCQGWNDLYRLSRDPDCRERRMVIYEKYWNSIMNQGMQLLISFILQVRS
jgi:hypothetical protein